MRLGPVGVTAIEPWLPFAGAVFQTGHVVPGFALLSRVSRITACTRTKRLETLACWRGIRSHRDHLAFR